MGYALLSSPCSFVVVRIVFVFLFVCTFFSISLFLVICAFVLVQTLLGRIKIVFVLAFFLIKNVLSPGHETKRIRIDPDRDRYSLNDRETPSSPFLSPRFFFNTLL